MRTSIPIVLVIVGLVLALAGFFAAGVIIAIIGLAVALVP